MRRCEKTRADRKSPAGSQHFGGFGLLLRLGHGRLTDSRPVQDTVAAAGTAARVVVPDRRRSGVLDRPTASLKQPSLRRMACRTLGRRNIAHGAEHQANSSPPNTARVVTAARRAGKQARRFFPDRHGIWGGWYSVFTPKALHRKGRGRERTPGGQCGHSAWVFTPKALHRTAQGRERRATAGGLVLGRGASWVLRAVVDATPSG